MQQNNARGWIATAVQSFVAFQVLLCFAGVRTASAQDEWIEPAAVKRGSPSFYHTWSDVGYWGQLDLSSPVVGQVYYVRAWTLMFSGSAAGYMYALIEFSQLPANTTFAISVANPVRCYRTLADNSTQPVPSCSQSPVASFNGYKFTDIVQMFELESLTIEVPVVTSVAILNTNPASKLRATINNADGFADPIVYPEVNVSVAAAAGQPPSISCSPATVSGSSARAPAVLNNNYTDGTATVEWGPTSSYQFGTTVAYPVNTQNTYNLFKRFTGLTPGSTVHWRAKYDSNGVTYACPDQSFTTVGFTSTDNPLQAGSTPVKAVHLAELRGAVATLRTIYDLPTVAWTDATLAPTVTVIKAAHITELRTALNGVYTAAGQTPPSYTPVTATQTVITPAQLTELRTALLAVW